MSDPKLEAAVAACEAAAATARNVSSAEAGDLGARTVESMHARELVRATCALAEARAQTAGDAGAAVQTRIAKAVDDVLGSL